MFIEYYELKCNEKIFVQNLKEKMPFLEEQIKKDIAEVEEILNKIKPKFQEIDSILFASSIFNTPKYSIYDKKPSFICSVFSSLILDLFSRNNTRIETIWKEVFPEKDMPVIEVFLRNQGDDELINRVELLKDLIRDFDLEYEDQLVKEERGRFRAV